MDQWYLVAQDFCSDSKISHDQVESTRNPFIQLIVSGGVDLSLSNGFYLYHMTLGRDLPGRFMKWYHDSYFDNSVIGGDITGWVMLRFVDSPYISLVDVVTNQSIDLVPFPEEHRGSMRTLSYGAFSEDEPGNLFGFVVRGGPNPKPRAEWWNVAVAFFKDGVLNVLQLCYTEEEDFHWKTYWRPTRYGGRDRPVDGIVFHNDKLLVMWDTKIVCGKGGHFHWEMDRCSELARSVDGGEYFTASFVRHGGKIYLLVIRDSRRLIFEFEFPERVMQFPNPPPTLRQVESIDAVVYTVPRFGGRGLSVDQHAAGTIFAAVPFAPNRSEVWRFDPAGEMEVVKNCSDQGDEECIHDFVWVAARDLCPPIGTVVRFKRPPAIFGVEKLI